MKRMFILILSLIILLIGCGQAGPDMPEEMPEDFDFSVRFGITARNEINTFEDRVTKDLIANGTATAQLSLTEDEMKGVYERMKKIRILRDLRLEARDGCLQVPYEEEYWTIQIDGEIREYYWTQEKCTLTKDAQQLRELRQTIFNIVKQKSAYQELPEAVGGYD